LNRYSYVINNPVNAIDPTGHICVGEPGECLENDGSMSGGFNGTGGTVSNPGAGNCSGASCQGNDNDDKDGNDILSPNKNEEEGSPLVSIAGVLLTISLGVLDGVIGYGIVASAAAAPLGLVAEVVLIPLEILSLDLTVYAAQMAATGRTDHDPLLVIHGFFPNFLPYKP
jgi:hypothetical protein